MTPKFDVSVTRFTDLTEIDGAWRSDDFRQMLDAMEYGSTQGMSVDDLRDMCLLSLQDLKPEKAAEVILTHLLGSRLRQGQIENMAVDMLEEKLWEDYADLSLHEALFNAGSLLYDAFPADCPKPDAVRVELRVTPINEAARSALAGEVQESLLVRLLADGLDESSALHRMFADQLSGDRFPEAASVVWIVEVEPELEGATTVRVTSSGAWLDAMRDTKRYESGAYEDDR